MKKPTIKIGNRFWIPGLNGIDAHIWNRICAQCTDDVINDVREEILGIAILCSSLQLASERFEQ